MGPGPSLCASPPRKFFYLQNGSTTRVISLICNILCCCNSNIIFYIFTLFKRLLNILQKRVFGYSVRWNNDGIKNWRSRCTRWRFRT